MVDLLLPLSDSLSDTYVRILYSTPRGLPLSSSPGCMVTEDGELGGKLNTNGNALVLPNFLTNFFWTAVNSEISFTGGTT